MNARTSVILLALVLCAAAAVLALRPVPKSTLEVGSQHADSDASAVALQSATTLAANSARVDDTSISASGLDARYSRGAVAADADGDETTSPLETGCAVDGEETRSLPSLRVAGAIRGSFVREGGPWTAADIPLENTVILDLASIENPTAPAVRAQFERSAAPDGSIAWTFEFADVLEGEYLLTLSALGARRWSPTSLRVRAPLAGILFTRFDKDRSESLAFEVVDVETNAPLATIDARHIQVTESAENGVFLHTGPLDLKSFPIDARFQWSLRVEGYATAFGDETAFIRRDDRRVATVRLVRGWTSRVFVLARDPTCRPARGAEVTLDGVRAGFTGSDGMLVVAAEAEPARIDVKLRGFRHHEGAESAGNYTARQRGGVTVVMLDRE